MSDLRITEAFLYMDYLVGAGRGWRVASRTPTCPVSLRLEEQPFCLLALGWDAFGVLSPAACSGAVLGLGAAAGGAEEGVVELTGKGVAPAAPLLGEGVLGVPERWGRGGGASSACDPVLCFPLCSLQRTFFPGRQEFSALPLAELQVLLKSHNQNGLLSARQPRSFGCY